MFESFLGPPPTRNSADTRSPTRREHAHTLRHAQRPNSKGGQTANRLRLLQLHARRAICRRLTAVRYNGWCWGPTDPIRYTHDRRIQPAENRNNPSPHTASNPRCLPPSVPHEVIQAGSRQLSVDRRSTNARLLVKFAPADRTYGADITRLVSFSAGSPADSRPCRLVQTAHLQAVTVSNTEIQNRQNLRRFVGSSFRRELGLRT